MPEPSASPTTTHTTTCTTQSSSQSSSSQSSSTSPSIHTTCTSTSTTTTTTASDRHGVLSLSPTSGRPRQSSSSPRGRGRGGSLDFDDSGISSARGLIQKILNQITMNDLPPDNEDLDVRFPLMTYDHRYGKRHKSVGGVGMRKQLFVGVGGGGGGAGGSIGPGTLLEENSSVNLKQSASVDSTVTGTISHSSDRDNHHHHNHKNKSPGKGNPNQKQHHPKKQPSYQPPTSHKHRKQYPKTNPQPQPLHPMYHPPPNHKHSRQRHVFLPLQQQPHHPHHHRTSPAGSIIQTPKNHKQPPLPPPPPPYPGTRGNDYPTPTHTNTHTHTVLPDDTLLTSNPDLDSFERGTAVVAAPQSDPSIPSLPQHHHHLASTSTSSPPLSPLPPPTSIRTQHTLPPHHHHPSSPPSITSSNLFHLPSSSSYSSYYDEYYYRPGVGGEVVMGNLSLAALCARTLDSVSGERIEMPLSPPAPSSPDLTSTPPLRTAVGVEDGLGGRVEGSPSSVEGMGSSFVEGEEVIGGGESGVRGGGKRTPSINALVESQQRRLKDAWLREVEEAASSSFDRDEFLDEDDYRRGEGVGRGGRGSSKGMSVRSISMEIDDLGKKLAFLVDKVDRRSGVGLGGGVVTPDGCDDDHHDDGEEEDPYEIKPQNTDEFLDAIEDGDNQEGYDNDNDHEGFVEGDVEGGGGGETEEETEDGEEEASSPPPTTTTTTMTDGVRKGLTATLDFISNSFSPTRSQESDDNNDDDGNNNSDNDDNGGVSFNVTTNKGNTKSEQHTSSKRNTTTTMQLEEDLLFPEGMGFSSSASGESLLVTPVTSKEMTEADSNLDDDNFDNKSNKSSDDMMLNVNVDDNDDEEVVEEEEGLGQRNEEELMVITKAPSVEDGLILTSVAEEEGEDDEEDNDGDEQENTMLDQSYATEETDGKEGNMVDLSYGSLEDDEKGDGSSNMTKITMTTATPDLNVNRSRDDSRDSRPFDEITPNRIVEEDEEDEVQDGPASTTATAPDDEEGELDVASLTIADLEAEHTTTTSGDHQQEKTQNSLDSNNENVTTSLVRPLSAEEEEEVLLLKYLDSLDDDDTNCIEADEQPSPSTQTPTAPTTPKGGTGPMPVFEPSLQAATAAEYGYHHSSLWKQESTTQSSYNSSIDTNLSPTSTIRTASSQIEAAAMGAAGATKHIKSTITTTTNQSKKTRRMQMFGSEYARHLSSSAFSPIVPKSKHQHRHSISTHHSSSHSTSSSTKKKYYNSSKHKIKSSLSGNSVQTILSTGSSSPEQNSEDYESTSISSSHNPTNRSTTSSSHHHPASTISGGSWASGSAPAERKVILEEASDDILSAAITDIIVTHGSDPPPKGYYRISQTSNGTHMDTIKILKHTGGGSSSSGSGSLSALGGALGVMGKKVSSLYLNVKKEPKWDRAVQRPCVTALTVIYPDRDEFVPPGFCVVRRHIPIGSASGDVDKRNAEKKTPHRRKKSKDDQLLHQQSSSYPANLNFGTSGERVYLCYRRSREGNPITGIIPLQPSDNETIPEGYTVLERTPRNFVADINYKAGPAVFLSFRQRLANLETLRPLPLVLSVYYAKDSFSGYSGESPVEVKKKIRSSKKGTKQLQTYYCTGGTVVPAEVGRFHVMDRSTHPLLSPSSVTNRLSLIQASRIKRLASSGTTSTSSVLGSSSSTSSSIINSKRGSMGSSIASDPGLGSLMESTTKTTTTTIIRHDNGSAENNNSSSSSQQLIHLAKGLVGQDLINPSTEHLFNDSGSCSMMESSKNSNSFMCNTSSRNNGSDFSLGSFATSVEEDEEVVGGDQNSSFSSTASGKRKDTTSDSNKLVTTASGREGKSLCIGGVEDGISHITLSNSSSSTTTTTVNNNGGSGSTHMHEDFPSDEKSIFVSYHDTLLQACFTSMEFIPPIECPRRTLLNIYERRRANILLQARIAIVTPIFTACYTQHGGSSMIAVEGLTKLLNETDFFLPDLAPHSDPLTSVRLTLLDLAIQVVCDVANSSARETSFLPCIEFVSEAVFYARCNLNSRTIGYVIRFYLFVFYFGASVPTSSSWPRFSSPSLKDGLFDTGNDTILLSEEEFQVGSSRPKDKEGKGGDPNQPPKQLPRRMGYVPGGAPQAAALALKELVSLHLGRLKYSSPPKKKGLSEEMTETKSEDDGSGIVSFMNNFVSSLVDNAIHQVDVANYTQLALHQIHRSGGSELFWHDMMTSCGVGLFTLDETSMDASMKDIYITSFAILSSVVKVASGKVRRISNSSQFVPRDVASKLLSIELILHFLQQWGSKVNDLQQKKTRRHGKKTHDDSTTTQMNQPEAIGTMAYIVRRLITPCLLSNTRSGIEDIRIFRRMVKIITELWCTPYYRQHIKIEMGVLIEHFVLKFLRLGPQVLPPRRLSSTSSSFLNELPNSLLPQQVSILQEVKAWFATEPRDILELYLNFDQVDAQASKKHFRLLPSTHWKITQQLCGSLCILAEQCTDIVSEQIRLTRIDLACVESPSSIGVPHNAATNHTEEDLKEMAHVREGARVLQEKCFDAISQIARSMMLCAAATSGANNNLLSKLRERKNDSVTWKDKLNRATSSLENGLPKILSDDVSVSSTESDGNMTVTSVSTIGNIVGGIMNKKKNNSLRSNGFDIPPSPKLLRMQPPSSALDADGGIVEYWQTSIAAERRKTMQVQVGEVPLRPPRSKKTSFRGAGGSNNNASTTPPRQTASGKIMSPSSNYTSHSQRRNDDASIVSFADDSTAKENDPQFSQQVEDTMNVAFEIIKTKGLKKSLDYLIACNFLTPSARDIASFLRLHQSKIDAVILGDYLGDGGKDVDDAEHFNLIRFNYICAISFVGMNVERGLRHLLTNCGFRLPGEAQKIDRIMNTFAQCFWEDNAGDHGKCPFQDQDTVFLISFAIIMLNTDLHKTSAFATPRGQTPSKQKQRKKMTKPEFLNNLRGVDNSEDLSPAYLSEIYDSIAANPIAINSPPDGVSAFENSYGTKTIRFSSGEYGHIIQGNMDLSGMLRHLIKSVKPSQELLRGLAAHEHPYLTIRSKSQKKKRKKDHVPEELIRSAFGSSWHHFHGIINSALDSAHLDPKGLENCLDVLMYALCATICLDLKVERNAFASQLVRVKFFRENRGLEEDDTEQYYQKKSPRIRDHLDYKEDAWFLRIERTAESYHENAKIAALDEVDGMFRKLHASLKVDSTLKKEMIGVARRIRNGQVLLNDPTRYFLKEGLLSKKCNRSGRNVKYTFFLFSDMLIYAREYSGQFKIHGELPLHLMKIMSISGTGSKKSQAQKRSFHIIHPRKSFLVCCLTPEEKDEWLQEVNGAIGREIKRLARIEGARQASAAFDR